MISSSPVTNGKADTCCCLWFEAVRRADYSSAGKNSFISDPKMLIAQMSVGRLRDAQSCAIRSGWNKRAAARLMSLFCEAAPGWRMRRWAGGGLLQPPDEPRGAVCSPKLPPAMSPLPDFLESHFLAAVAARAHLASFWSTVPDPEIWLE